MTIRAQLADGTTLEFPDGTEDSVVDNVVKKHMSSSAEKPVDTSHNWKGLAAGLYDLGRSAVVDFPLQAGMAVGSLLRGEPAAVARSASKQATEDATKGLRASDISPEATQSSTYKYMMYPFEKMGQGLEWLGDKAADITGNKDIGEGTKIALDIGSAVVPVPGAKFAGKTLIKGAEKLDPAIRKQKYTKPDDLTPAQQERMRADNREWRKANKHEEHLPPEVYDPWLGPEKEPFTEVDTSGITNEFGGKTGGLFREGSELPPDAVRESPSEKTLTPEQRVAQNNLNRWQEEETAAAADYEARQREFGPDRPETNPQDLAIDYDPFGLKDLAALDKVPDNLKLADEGLDYSLLPETVNKDFVLQNQLKRFEELKARLGEVVAKELTLKQPEGPSYYPNTEINEKFQREFKKEQDKLQKNLENLKKEIDTRLRNEHGWSYPSLEGPKQPYSRSIYTRQSGQPFRTPDMQRSPDAKITGSDKVVKTNPFRGPGKKQVGAIDPQLFNNAYKAIKELSGGFKIHLTGGRNGPEIEIFNPQGKSIAYSGFESTHGGPLKTKEKSTLQSEDTYVSPDYQRLGLAAEMYQMLAEHGADIIPSNDRTAAGKAMWDGFEKYGISENQKINRDKYNRISRSQRGAIDLSVFGEGLAKVLSAGKSVGKFGAGVAKSIVQEDRNAPKITNLKGVDKIRAITGSDGRDIKTFVSDFIKNKDQFTDIPDAASLKGIGIKDLTPSAVGKLTYNRNPIISYMSHQYDKIDGMIRHAKEEALWGLKSGLSTVRGIPTKIKSDAGARTIMKTLPRARREGFRAAVVKYMDGELLEQMGLPDPTDGMLMAEGLNAREIQAYRAARAQFDKVVDIINTMRTKAGMTPIAKRPGYFPSIWMGDWRVFVRNDKGELLKVLAFDNKMEVDSAIAEIKKADPTFTAEASDASKNKYNLKDLSAFQLATEVFGKNTPQVKLLEQIRNDILKRRGFMKHSIQKKGVEGFLGSAEGGFKDMEKAIDIYLEQAYNYIGDMQKKNLLGEFHAELEKNKYSLSTEKPNTNKYLSDITANSIGSVKNVLEGFDSVVEFFGEFAANKTGIGGRSTGKNSVRTLNGLASFWNLATAKQWAINAMQPLYALPKARQVAISLGTEGITSNFLKSYMEAFVPGTLSKESKAALEFARDSGMIDARILDLINANSGIGASKLTKGTGHAASWWEQEAVRVPVLLFYNKMLESVIKDPKERHSAAAQMTADTMVNYSKTQTPAIYAQMGLVGEILRPYQQYSHNYHGQLAEYVNIAARDKALTPLAGFLGVQVMTAGLRGLVPLATATGIINMINMWSDDPIPTPEEYLLGSGVSDFWVFGPMSKFTDMDLSSSASAPSLLAAPGMPGVSFAKNMIQDVGGYAMDKMRGMDTEAQEMQAAMTATPNAAKGLTELMYTPEDGRVPNPRRDMQPDMPGPRTDKDWMIRIGMGATPYSEGVQKARIRGAEAMDKKANAKRTELMNKVVDDFMSKGDLNEKLLDRLANELGPDVVDKFFSEVESTIKKRLYSRAQAMALKSTGLDQARKMELLQQFQVELEGASLEDLEEVAATME